MLGLAVLASAGLVSADASSGASSSGATLSAGTWGAHTAPNIALATAYEAGAESQHGVGAGDVLVVAFDKPTNRPAVSTTAAVDALLTFGSPLGQAYTGAWSTKSELTLTLVAVGEFDARETVGLQIVAPATFKSYEDFFSEKYAQENLAQVENMFIF